MISQSSLLHLLDLPDDCLLKVVSFLDSSEILASNLVCKCLWKLKSDRLLIRRLAREKIEMSKEECQKCGDLRRENWSLIEQNVSLMVNTVSLMEKNLLLREKNVLLREKNVLLREKNVLVMRENLLLREKNLLLREKNVLLMRKNLFDGEVIIEEEEFVHAVHARSK